LKFLRNAFDAQARHFHKGGKLEKFYPLFEAIDAFIFTPGRRAERPPHIHDSIELKRLMTVVVIALTPCVLMAIYNQGFQAQSFMAETGSNAPGWVGFLLAASGLSTGSISAIILHGLLLFLPLYLVTMLVGGAWEVLFAIVRKHEVNEGFLVTGLLFPLILPASIPLWQVALGVSFGVVVGKEIFGGTGMNVLNPALVGRVFLFFAYPVQISGDSVWVAVDGYSSATPLAELASMNSQDFGAFAQGGVLPSGVSWTDAFLGLIPGSLGETSALACLIGAFILIATGIGSWRIMLSSFLGMVATATLLKLIGSETNPAFAMGWTWHLVVGSFAFGTVFMATDPVTASVTNIGKWVYGGLIGFLIVLVRVLNPAYPEGTMLAILFMNLFAPLIDYYVVKANIKRREARLAVQQ